MEFDVESHLGAVHRSVAFLQRDGKPASAVTLSRAFATTLEDAWDAVTNGERIPRWFTTVTVAISNLAAATRWRATPKARLRSASGCRTLH